MIPVYGPYLAKALADKSDERVDEILDALEDHRLDVVENTEVIRSLARDIRELKQAVQNFPKSIVVKVMDGYPSQGAGTKT